MSKGFIEENASHARLGPGLGGALQKGHIFEALTCIILDTRAKAFTHTHLRGREIEPIQRLNVSK